MRAVLSLVSLAFVGGSVLPGSTQVSIALCVVALLIAAGAVGTYFLEEYRRQQPVSLVGRGKSRSLRSVARSTH